MLIISLICCVTFELCYIRSFCIFKLARRWLFFTLVKSVIFFLCAILIRFKEFFQATHFLSCIMRSSVKWPDFVHCDLSLSSFSLFQLDRAGQRPKIYTQQSIHKCNWFLSIWYRISILATSQAHHILRTNEINDSIYQSMNAALLNNHLYGWFPIISNQINQTNN